jgi:uncharacterized protein YyaL (SSP411 family)
MMLHTYAEAGRVLGSDPYIEAATSNAEFILRELRTGDRLFRTWRDGRAKIDAFLEDYAILLDSLVELYHATYDLRWIREARWVADRMIDRFWSSAEEIFFDAPADKGGLILRARDIYDNATPSGTSAAAHALVRLARLSGDPEYERIAGRVISGMADMASRVPQAFGHLLSAIVTYITPPTEVAIVGVPGAPDTEALLEIVRTRYLPHTTVAFSAPDADSAAAANQVPLLAHREPLQGRATAFVCERYTCRQPVNTVDDLERDLSEVIGKR